MERSNAASRAGRRHGGLELHHRPQLRRRKAETGSLAPAKQGRPIGGGRLAQHVEALIGWVEADGDITMPELATKLLAERGIAAHPASLSRLLIQHGFTVKKNAAGERNRSR